MCRQYSAWKLSPDKVETSTLPGALASHGGQISSPRRRRHDKCVIVWPLRSADRSRPPRCFMRKVNPTTLNPLTAIEGSRCIGRIDSYFIFYVFRATRVQFDSTSNSFVENRRGDAEAVSRISSALLIATVRPAL